MLRSLLAFLALPFAAVFARPQTFFPSEQGQLMPMPDKVAERAKKREALQVARQQKRAEKDLARQLKKEAKLYGDLIVATYARLGQFYASRWRYDTGPDAGSNKRKSRTAYVRFEKIFTTPEVIYFKILVRKKTFFGTKSALPHRVRVADLVSEDTCFELGFSCQRAIRAKYDNVRYGAWIMVHRNEGFDALPKRVEFDSVLPHYPEDMSDAHLILGIGEHRKVISSSLAHSPHMLVGGSTGSGKSNFVNYLMCSWMRLCDPDAMKFVLIDLKSMEFVYYENSPYLLHEIPLPDGKVFPIQGIVTEPEDAIKTLDAIARLIKIRAKMLSGQAKELASWNKKYPDRKMPRVVVIIDEFAELMLASGSKVGTKAEELVTRITNLGRAVGIHVITCTQRPAVNVVPNSIKVNMPLVVAGRTPNDQQSRVIIDTGAAAELPDVPGRMAIRLGPNIIEVQTPFISDDQVLETVNIARGKGLGITRMIGTHLEIEPEGLTEYIVEHLDGSLSPDLLKFEFRPYGITNRMLNGYAEVLKQNHGLQTLQKIYGLEKRGNSWFIVVERDLAPAEPTVAPEQPIIATELPPDEEPDIIQPEPEPMPQPEPEPEPDNREPWQIFFQEECILDPLSKIRSSVLYNTYVQWSLSRNEMPIAQITFSKSLKAIGIAVSRSTGSWFMGVRLREAQTEQTEQGERDEPILEAV